jgi:UV DNA damage endonuclease
MSLGLCCQYIEPQQKRNGTVVYKNTVGDKTLQLGRFMSGEYSPDKVKDTYLHNIRSHYSLIPKLVAGNIQSFRISSSLLPLWDLNKHVFGTDPDILESLRTLGRMFIDAGIRVTTHPGQFTVLSSDSARVVKNSIAELDMHAWVFDAMGFERSPYHAINIHGGKSNRSKQLISVIRNLDHSVRSRLTLENDERCYSVSELLDIYAATDVPVVFDSHHFTFNQATMTFDEAYLQTMSTWSKVKPLQHISNTEPGLEQAAFNKRRAHSDYIHSIPEQQLADMLANTIDVDVEAKRKNLAIQKIKLDFGILI